MISWIWPRSSGHLQYFKDSRIWALAKGATTVASYSAGLPAFEVFQADAVPAKVGVPGDTRLSKCKVMCTEYNLPNFRLHMSHIKYDKAYPGPQM